MIHNKMLECIWIVCGTLHDIGVILKIRGRVFRDSDIGKYLLYGYLILTYNEYNNEYNSKYLRELLVSEYFERVKVSPR